MSQQKHTFAAYINMLNLLKKIARDLTVHPIISADTEMQIPGMILQGEAHAPKESDGLSDVDRRDLKSRIIAELQKSYPEARIVEFPSGIVIDRSPIHSMRPGDSYGRIVGGKIEFKSSDFKASDIANAFSNSKLRDYQRDAVDKMCGVDKKRNVFVPGDLVKCNDGTRPGVSGDSHPVKDHFYRVSIATERHVKLEGFRHHYNAKRFEHATTADVANAFHLDNYRGCLLGLREIAERHMGTSGTESAPHGGAPFVHSVVRDMYPHIVGDFPKPAVHKQQAGRVDRGIRMHPDADIMDQMTKVAERVTKYYPNARLDFIVEEDEQTGVQTLEPCNLFSFIALIGKEMPPASNLIAIATEWVGLTGTYRQALKIGINGRPGRAWTYTPHTQK